MPKYSHPPVHPSPCFYCPHTPRASSCTVPPPSATGSGSLLLVLAYWKPLWSTGQGFRQTKRGLNGRWSKWCGWGVTAISLHLRLTQENFGLDNRLKMCGCVCVWSHSVWKEAPNSCSSNLSLLLSTFVCFLPPPRHQCDSNWDLRPVSRCRNGCARGSWYLFLCLFSGCGSVLVLHHHYFIVK